jgi:CRISPR-associated protein Cas1
MTVDAVVGYAEGVEVVMATLYLSVQYSVVKLDGEALRVDMPEGDGSRRRGRVVRVPLAKVEQVMVFGEVTLTTPVLHTLMERRVSVHYLSAFGRSYGALVADPAKNAGLRLAQYGLHGDCVRRFEVARQVVAGKLLNMRTVLLRYARERDDGEPLREAAEQVRGELRQLAGLRAPEAVSSDDRMHGLGVLFGLEGRGSQVYFGVFGRLLKGDWVFSGRVRRPPRDPVNALLSFGYAVLTNQVMSLVCAVGLDPAVGVLHQPGFGKPALALDLVEEFRPVVVDSVVLTVLNTGQVVAGDFVEELGAFRLGDEPRKVFLSKLEERLNTVVQHPVFGYKVSYRRCIELQARLFAKFAQGEVDRYVPFTVR